MRFIFLIMTLLFILPKQADAAPPDFSDIVTVQDLDTEPIKEFSNQVKLVKVWDYNRLRRTAANIATFNKWDDARWEQELQKIPLGGIIRLNFKDASTAEAETFYWEITDATEQQILYSQTRPTHRDSITLPGRPGRLRDSIDRLSVVVMKSSESPSMPRMTRTACRYCP